MMTFFPPSESCQLHKIITDLNAKCFRYIVVILAFLHFHCVTRTRLPPDRDPRHGNAPFFGIQMAPECEGIIKLGDPVLISC